MIHKTSIVNPKAKISNNVEIGPYCTIGPEVEIGANSILHSHVNIEGNTKIGKNNQIYPFSSIGTPPQDLKYKGEKNSLIVGDNVLIGGGSGVIKNIPSNTKVMGYPARNIRNFLKENKYNND